jgi:hypothetical protein
MVRMTLTAAMPRRRKDAEDLTTPDVVPITIRFPAALRKAALGVAQDEDRSFASLVIYALRRYVEAHQAERS